MVVMGDSKLEKLFFLNYPMLLQDFLTTKKNKKEQ
jgi:hypothetical protein